MYAIPSDKSCKWVRADAGHDIGRLIYAGGLVVTTQGLIKEDDVNDDDLVLVKAWPTGALVFVENGRLSEYPPGGVKIQEPGR
jgi:hypothetical protein